MTTMPSKKENAEQVNQSQDTRKKQMPLTGVEQTQAIFAGLVAAWASAAIWYLVIKFTGYEWVYLAILIGVGVAYAMNFILQGRTSKTLAIVAAILTLTGILTGKFLTWQLELPQWTRDELVANYGYTQSEVKAISDEEIHKEYPFREYLKDDITSTESGANPLITLMMYGAALFYSAQAVVALKEE